MNGQLKISGTDADEVRKAAKALAVGEYSEAFDWGIQETNQGYLFTATLHKKGKLG